MLWLATPLLLFAKLWLESLFVPSEPDNYVEERHTVEVYQKRQADLGQLLQLASLAGITALPTDPALLLSLGPYANSLAAQLPTPSVLSVLLTAAPSGFISSIVNDPSFASSFESDFQKGSSPSWYNGLPTDVKSYLHTYSGFVAAATAAEGVKSEVSGSGSGLVTGSTAGTGAVVTATATATATGMASGATGMMTMTTTGMSASMTSMASSAAAEETSSASSESESSSLSSAASAATGPASSLSSGAGGPAAVAQPTGAVVAGVAAFAGILGVIPWI